MTNSNLPENHDENNNKENHILNLVKDALKEAKLLDQLIIEERKEGYLLKPKSNNKQEKIKAFETLAGSAIKSGENVDDLIKMGKREEKWRDKEVE
ncbi:hypothetical protein [Virgibacillus sp. DJP39]|uniref:hypothetical protein n=1 Tax=Virgibacillus sp. DJP39 TaxID=3409790 RepID=UPI003BB69834